MLRRTILLFLLTLTLASCGTQSHNPNLTDMPKPDLPDSLLQDSIALYLQQNNAPLNSRYEYTRIDLNDDGFSEGIVLLTLPHNYWCGWGGCTVIIFAAKDDYFAPLSIIKNIRPPVLISPVATNGWYDLILNLSGYQTSDKTTVLMFDGQTYPFDTMNAPSVPYPISAIKGQKLFP